MRPAPFFSVAKHALAIPRFNIMRPAPATLTPCGSSSSSGARPPPCRTSAAWGFGLPPVGHAVPAARAGLQFLAPLGDQLVFVGHHQPVEAAAILVSRIGNAWHWDSTRR